MNEYRILPVPLACTAAYVLPRDAAEWPLVLTDLIAEAGALRQHPARGEIWWCDAAAREPGTGARLLAALTAACEAAGLPAPQEHPLDAGRRTGEALCELARRMDDGAAACAVVLLAGASGQELWLVGPGPDERRARKLAAVQPLTADGLMCAELDEDGQDWRLGAACADWRQALLAVGKAPFSPQEAVREAAARELAQRGVWLGRGEAAPLAAMCCGQGSVWPGMGRELYDQFPAARAAMDRLAACADWDVLALLDEKDEERIGLTRWQQPYLFLLEYAQWSHLRALGLRPALVCGHSLGELIALCLAGVYDPETAWYILDTRARHMAELEARATRETGMMAVHAEAGLIEEARRLWPALYVSNYNTPRQYIVSGPRDMLMEARKHFRKQRLPAIMLNVSLAFHHPGMRVLRDMSLRRLNALPMQAPRLPLLSCVTTGFYPAAQREICDYIADLDENAVRWVECVRHMWNRDGIRHFVELGPQDTLCGLVADIEPQALCLSAARKGREADGLRRTCAALYALGHLDAATLAAHAARADASPAPAVASAPVTAPGEGNAPLGPLARRVMRLLEEAAGLSPDSVTPQWDLRHDLALRSSRFPLLVQQLEGVLGRGVAYEDLMGVYTVGDLLAALGLSAPTPAKDAPAGEAETASGGRGGDALDRPPFVRYAATAGGTPAPAPWDPEGHGPGLRAGGVVVAWSRDGLRLARLLEGVAALGQGLIVPAACRAACARLERLGCVVRCPQDAASGALGAAADMSPESDAEAALAGFFRAALILAEAEGLPLSGCLLEVGERDGGAETAIVEAELCRPGLPQPGWRWLVRDIRPEAAEAFVRGGTGREDGAAGAATGWRQLGILQDGLSPLAREWGDMLAREICLCREERLLWARAGALRSLLPLPAQDARLQAQPWRERPENFPGLYAPASLSRPISGRDFPLCGEFSRYARPWLAQCGGQPGALLPELPLSESLRLLLDGARLYFPWLTPNGLCDVRCGAPLPLPPGVTREVRLDVRAQDWLQQDAVTTRMCRCRMDVRELAANGRHTDRWQPLVAGMALLGREAAGLPPLWESGGRTGDAQPGGTAELTAFYEGRRVGPSSRLLAACLPDGAAFAPGGDGRQPGRTLRFALHGASGIAPEDVSGYTLFLRLVDAVEQGAWWTQESLFDGDAAAWRLTGVGFIRFGQADARRAAVLELRCGWRTDRLRRFDAQVCDADGRPLVTLNQMEFEPDMTETAPAEAQAAGEGSAARELACASAAQEQGARA